MPNRGAPWYKLSGMLARETGRGFERAVLPFLRFRWPLLVQAPSTEVWDRKGIDLFEWSDRGRLPCVVQCKGFKEREIGDSQIRQAIDSIRAFRASDVCCDTYLLVHNRDNRNAKFREKVEAELKVLKDAGKANHAYLCDRQAVLDRAVEDIQRLLQQRLLAHSQSLLEHFRRLFRYGHYYLPFVPVAEKRLVFKNLEPCVCEEVSSATSCEVSRIILSSSETRWTMLTGSFGSGKSTAALHAATFADQTIILAQCASLLRDTLAQGTNWLLKGIIASLDIFAEFDEYDQELVSRLAGYVLTKLLKSADCPYTLILDGLDEHSHFSELRGLQQLSNQLAELTCGIVLTTRREHLDAMFGNFSLAFDELSTGYSRRDARLLELLPWTERSVLQLLEQIVGSAQEPERSRLEQLANLVKTREYSRVYGDILLNPLFLQFILEDVADDGIQRRNRTELLLSWVKRKTRRDLQAADRLRAGKTLDAEDFVGRMVAVMENVARTMVVEQEGRLTLAESTDQATVEKEAGKTIGPIEGGVLSILLNSLLIPKRVRRGVNLEITFAFRVFQEFFLARYLLREGVPCDGFPDAVRSFYHEMKQISE